MARSKRIAVCIGGIGTEYQTPLIRSVTKACREITYKVSLFQAFLNQYEGQKNEDGDFNIFELINFELFDGLILFPMTLRKPETLTMLLARARAHHLPVICVDGAQPGCYNININYDSAIEQLTEHLIENHGFRKINYIGGDETNLVARRRKESYIRVLEKHGIPVEPERMGNGWFWSTPAGDVVRAYYKKTGEMPEAFVCANDEMAIGAIRMIQQLGFRVPQDVAVTGLDGMRKALNFCPALTTAKPDLDLAGQVTVARMQQMLASDFAWEGEEVIGCTFHYQESCACASFSHAVNSEIKEKLFEEINWTTDYFSWSNQTLGALTCADSVDEIVAQLNVMAQHFWTGKVWICICDTFFDANAEYKGVTQGYTDTMIPLVCCENHEVIAQQPFPVTEMIPDFERECEHWGAQMYVPLHFQEQAIGYIAVEYSDIVLPMEMLFNLVNNVGVVMENARIRIQLNSMVEQLQMMSVQDPMTKLLNRRGFYRDMTKAFAKCVAEKKHFLVVSIDLDGLKAINDNYGHHEGDRAIKTMAEILASVATGHCVAARFGGDEFIVAGEVDADVTAEGMIEQIQDLINQTNDQHVDAPYRLVMSHGIQQGVPSADNTIDEWISVADERMYSLKNEHKRRSRGRR